MSVLPLQRDPQSAPFFDATALNTLLLRACQRCGHWNAPDRSVCSRCSSAHLSWARSCGCGTVVSWAAVHSRSEPSSITVVGIIELDEGPWLRGQLRSSPAATYTGMRVAADYVAAEGGEAIPVFAPVEDHSLPHRQEI